MIINSCFFVVFLCTKGGVRCLFIIFLPSAHSLQSGNKGGLTSQCSFLTHEMWTRNIFKGVQPSRTQSYFKLTNIRITAYNIMVLTIVCVAQ